MGSAFSQGNRDVGQFWRRWGSFSRILWRTSVVRYSEIKPEMSAESRGTRKKKADLKMDLHLKWLCFPPAREQTMPEEFI